MQRLFTPEKKKVVFFDMNNTLITRKNAFEKSFQEAVREFTARWSGEEDIRPERIWRRYDKEWRRLKPQSGQPLGERRGVCLTHALKPYPIAVTQAFADTFFDTVKRLQPLQADLLPGAQKTLEQLSGHYRIGVISNGSEAAQRAIIHRLGLSAYIPERNVFATTRSGLRKPNIGIFRQAVKSMGVAPSQAVMVGDSWRRDVFGATRAGIDAVWIARTKRKTAQRKVGRERVVTIRSISQLKSLFLC